MGASLRLAKAARVAQALAVAGVIAYAIQGSIPLAERTIGDFVENWGYPVLFLIPGALCIARAVAMRDERAAWAVLGGALLAWSAGEVYWNLAIGDSVPPAFTPSDVLWLSFYPACLAGIVMLVRGRVRRLHAGLTLDGVIAALGLCSIGAALVFGAVVGERTLYPEDFPVDVATFFCDLCLLGVTVAVLAVTAWRPGRAVALVGSGLVLSAVVDGFFLWQGATGFELKTTAVAALWPAAATLVGIAAWQPPARVVIARIEGWRAVALPTLFSAAALVLLLVHLVTPVNGLALGLAVATIAASIARMTLTLVQHIRLLADSRREALTDALTGLSNRRRLMIDLEDLATTAAPDEPRALLLFDLDGFKQYNDWHGHPAGDALLRRLGERLGAAVNGHGCAYRLGGDEFCVIVQGTELEARRARGAALEALTDSSQGFEVASSCGLVMMPADADTASGVLQLADERLYAQKARRRRFSVGRQTTNALLQAIQEREPDLRDHQDRVADLARDLGIELGLAGEELDELIRAAELHDVGKVAVPDAILRKPGPLNELEWDFMREHTIVGDRILSAAPELQGSARIVRASHERYDGRGYPDRLMAEEIPLGARVVAVCDAFHAMTTNRPYREAVTREQALAELQRCAGRQFDPMVVESFTRLVAGRMGIVARAVGE
jgi:two-component system cell cycle response regulator